MQHDSKVPIPFNESHDPEVFWGKDPCDTVVPKGGLISDIVYYERGHEVPTLYTIWASLYMLSSAIKREAWFEWADERLFTNWYTIIVGPAGIVKKNRALTTALAILEGMTGQIPDPQIRRMKRIEVLSGGFTPEALYESLRDCKRHRADFTIHDENGNALLDEKGEAVIYRRTSELAIALFEMSTTIGKQK